MLSELQRRGHAVVEEPGRRIVSEELAKSGSALPWVDPGAFAQRAIGMARNDRARAAEWAGWVFFDRGLVDAAAALEHVTGRPVLPACRGERYHRRVFMAPPWPEIHVRDADRRHGFEEAIAEYDRLLIAFETLGYDICVLPKSSVTERADFILATLEPG